MIGNNYSTDQAFYKKLILKEILCQSVKNNFKKNQIVA